MLFCGRQKRSLRYELGLDSAHTVFEGKVVASGLGTELFRTERKRSTTASIFIDKQASTQSTQSSRSTPEQYFTDHLNHQMLRVFKRHPDLRLTICWIPGHRDVSWHEAVDVEAKKAATEGSSPKCLSSSAARSPARLKVCNTAMKPKSPRKATICRIDDTVPSNSHALLNKHLHRLKCAASPTCEQCDKEEETVMHYLIMCPAYERFRTPLRVEFGIDIKSIPLLLTEPKAMRFPLRYIGAAPRFKTEFGELALSPEVYKKAKKKT